MIGIIITQQILDQNNHAWLNGKTVGTIVTRPNYPNKFWVTKKYDCAYQHKTAIHEADGWRDVVQPEPPQPNQKRGEIYFDEENDVFTYQVVDKSPEEIQSQLLNASEATKAQRIKEIQDALILEETYNETDVETILNNIDLYPTFTVGIEVKDADDSPNGIPYRCKDFNNENELVLWETINSHTTQADWRPKDVPALFKRVALDGEIPVFVQPTGAHDAYQIGDKVHFPTANDPVYESLIPNNVYSPLAYPQGWQLVE